MKNKKKLDRLFLKKIRYNFTIFCTKKKKCVTILLQFAKMKKKKKKKPNQMFNEDTLVPKIHPKLPSKNLDFHPNFYPKYFVGTGT